ncbi:MAG: bifunctional glutamate N-acetyltransferase/amino-acid acetyltransferase ArgJ [Candidatus Margulisiibacteriota bacterium]
MAHITDLDGVYAAALASGIKPNKLDLGYIFVPGAVASAGVFTQNKVAAPCVVFNKKNNDRHIVKAVVVNAGNANAATGEQGAKDVKKTAALAAEKLGLLPSEVAVASTGIIGVPLPMDKVEAGLNTLLKTPKVRHGDVLAKAIMTTDLCVKEVFVQKKIGKKNIVVAGMAKGSGMIAPNMATMLGFLVTNANLDHAHLQEALSHAVNRSFNMISVDTDTSTNDMVLIQATGERQFSVQDKAEWQAFLDLLTEACTHLAKLIAKDGEGATKLIEVTVNQAASVKDAKRLALSIVNSPLVKTAIHGADPNWGRVMAAAGKVEEAKLNPAKATLHFGEVLVFEKGAPTAFDVKALRTMLSGDTVQITLNLNLGKSAATAWGCDLTKGYIDINTQYS